MSRVDEALRRAAEQSASAAMNPVAGQASPAGGPFDAAALADEPFPIEIREHKRVQRPSVEPSTTPAPPSATEAPSQPLATPSHDTSGGLLERMNSAVAEKIVVDDNMSSTSREQYRRLAAILHHSQQSTGLTVVMVTSAVPGEGKTLTCTNLALTLSESYQRRVLLIDADLRRPSLHTIFGVDNSTGLSDGLTAAQERKMTVRQISDRLAVLPAGRPTSDPMAGLISDRMRRLLEEARAAYDWVIIDTPPVALLPDAHILTAMLVPDVKLFGVDARLRPDIDDVANNVGLWVLVPRKRDGPRIDHACVATQDGERGEQAAHPYGSRHVQRQSYQSQFSTSIRERCVRPQARHSAGILDRVSVQPRIRHSGDATDY